MNEQEIEHCKKTVSVIEQLIPPLHEILEYRMKKEGINEFDQSSWCKHLDETLTNLFCTKFFCEMLLTENSAKKDH